MTFFAEIFANRRAMAATVIMAAYLFAACLASTARATEPSRQFVEGLRERGLHEMALEYIKELPNNPLAPSDFVRTSAYEEAATYIDWAGRTRDFREQEDRLKQGEAKLKQFQATNANHPLASSAEMQIGNIALHRARMKKLQAADLKRTEEERSALVAEAIKLFGEANKSFAGAEIKFKTARDKIRRTSPKPEDRELRDTLRNGMLHSGVNAANALYEMAKSQQDGSEDQKKSLREAARVYEELFFKYQRYTLGSRFNLQQARCLQETNDKDDVETALMIYSQYAETPANSPAERELKLLAAAYHVAALSSSAVMKFGEALKMGENSLRQAASSDKSSDEYMTLTMELALANEAASKNTKDPVKKRTYVGNAVQLARAVERSASTQRAKAQQLLERLQSEPQGPQSEPTTYIAALMRANGARAEWEGATESIKEAEKTKNEKAKAEFEKLATEKRTEAEKYYNLAIRLADEKTTADDISQIRYILCYLYWSNGDYYRAAALGEYIAEMYPKTPSAQSAALLAMESYKRLYAAVEEGSKAFELARLTSLAEMIAENWPKDNAGSTALLTLFNFAIRDAYDDSLSLAERSQKLDDAAAILEKVGEGTPNSVVAAIQLGQGYWRQYLLSLQEPADKRIPEEDLEALADKAKRYLNKGVASSGEGEVDATVAKAALSLAKILVDDSELEKATELLEDKHHGPLALVEAKHQAAQADGFAVDTYKTALRAYIGSEPQRIDDAKAMLERLKNAIGRDSKARERLDAELINIGIRLKKQLDNAQLKEGNEKQVQALAKGIQVFLGEIGKANDEYNTLSWVASTFYNLGESFREAASEKKTGKEAALQEAQRYYEEADKVYRRIMQAVSDDPAWGPANKIGLQVRYANLLLRLKEYDSATKILTDILTKKPTMLTIQVEAAKAYQAWAEHHGKADSTNMEKMLNRALAGHLRHPEDRNKKIVWGWDQLRRLTSRDIKKFGPYYHEASYNMAYCLFQQSTLLNGDASKKRAELAEQVIDIAQNSDKKLGGSEMYRKYDALLRNVQAALGKPAVGLKKST